MSDQNTDWRAIYEQHGLAMRRTARRQLRANADAKDPDDLVFEVLAEVMATQDPTTWDNPTSYLCQAVRHRAHDAGRRNDFEDEREAVFDEKVGGEEVEASAERHILTGAALEALRGLPERERFAIEQRVMGTRPAKEVAVELDVSPQRVSQLVSAGVRKLRATSAFTGLVPVDSPTPPSRSDHPTQKPSP